MKNILVTTLLTLPAFGAAADAPETSVGIEAGVGSSDYDSASDNIDASWTGAIYLGRHITSNWQVMVGLHTGSGTSVPEKDIGVATEVEEELQYSAISLSPNWLYQLSTKHALYASVGINYSQTEVELDSVKTIDGSGLGYIARAGWQYTITEHYMFNFGVQRLGLSEVDVNSANIGISYHF